MKFTSESPGRRPSSRRFDHKSSPPATGITILAVFGFLLVAGEGASISSAAEQGPVAAVPEPGFESLFDGRTLDGWQGDRTIWSVQDGAITGRTTADTGLKENNFLIWKMRWKTSNCGSSSAWKTATRGFTTEPGSGRRTRRRAIR
jgi:hypothetical protein